MNNDTAENRAPDQPVRVCLVTDTYWPATGGVEAWVHAHSAHLRKKFQVSIVAHARDNTLSGILSRTVFLKSFSTFQDDYGNRVSCLSPGILGRIVMLPLIFWNFPFVRRFFPKPAFDFLYVFYKAAFFRKLSDAVADADIVHCFSTGYLAACTTDTCRKRNVKFIHSPPVHFNKWGDTPLLLSSYAKADAVLCLSEAFKRDFKKHAFSPAPDILVVPALTIQNTDSRQPYHVPQPPFILFLGRREKHKGLDLLLSAFEECARKATLIVAGPGKKVTPASPSVIDLGEVGGQEKQWLLEHCDIFCVPSADESFGIVYAEAMRCARPVVALDIAPVNEIVVQGETGILVPQGNRAALAEALLKLLLDKRTREEMGRKGCARYNRIYSPSVVLDQIVMMYGKVLAEKHL
jgi:glycosyltransferase involved in cell wall biosynthesis